MAEVFKTLLGPLQTVCIDTKTSNEQYILTLKR